jgi:RNA polymerase sigma-70 factor (ECF subfamily)
MTDGVLEGVAAGRPEAVQECMTSFGGLIWSLARRMLGSGPDAEDAVQEVFIELWRSAGRFDPARATEDQFVAMIARRRIIDRLRRRTARPEPVELPEALPGESQSAELGGVERRDEAQRAIDALAGLRPEVRQVVELAVMGGHSHGEVSQATGLPLGTVKSHVRRGLMNVRRALGVAEGLPA